MTFSAMCGAGLRPASFRHKDHKRLVQNRAIHPVRSAKGSWQSVEMYMVRPLAFHFAGRTVRREGFIRAISMCWRRQSIGTNTGARRRRQAGNTILEMAFLLFPTLAIICAFLDVGMALFVWNTPQNAVREGTRYAITYQVDSSGTQIQSIKDTVATWSMNFVNGASTSATSPAVPYVDVEFYTTPTSSNPTGTLVTGQANANAPGNIVTVAVKNYPYKWMAPFSGALSFYAAPGSSLSITAYSADVLGGKPLTWLPAQ